MVLPLQLPLREVKNLFHILPFQLLHLYQLFQGPISEPVRMRVCGKGMVDYMGGEAQFALLKTTFCQDPGDIHPVLIPDHITIGEVMILHRDPTLGEILCAEQGTIKQTYQKVKGGSHLSRQKRCDAHLGRSRAERGFFVLMLLISNH